MGLADLLLPVPAFDGSASLPLQQSVLTPAIEGRGEGSEKNVKVSNRKRKPESHTVGGAREKEADQAVKVLERSAKKVKSAIRVAPDSVTVAADSKNVGQGHDAGAQLCKKDAYGAVHAQLQARIKTGKGSGKNRRNEEGEKSRKVWGELGKNGKLTTVETVHNQEVAAVSNGTCQGLLENDASKTGGSGALSTEAERRARKNAKRKQRRERALGFRGNGQHSEGPGKVNVGKNLNVDAPLVSKKSKKGDSSLPPRCEKGDTAETANTALAQSLHHAEKTQPPRKAKPTTFLEKIQARLWGGRFRMLNETLYTCNGQDAFDLFKKDPSAFEIYHAGYQEQMSRWPKLPVHVIADWLRAHSADLVVADFGCGDGRLAGMVENRVFSLDLVASNPSVIACNMANVRLEPFNNAVRLTPLDTSSVDVAVFCLSLMGTDYPSYLKEAHRVIRPSGWLLIAEVRSRFDPNNGGADPGEFSQALKSLGFSPEFEDSSNKMFLLLYFKKQAGKLPKIREANWPELKPCAYKRR